MHKSAMLTLGGFSRRRENIYKERGKGVGGNFCLKNLGTRKSAIVIDRGKLG